MNKRTPEEKPEVYALRQDGSSWQISRRDFLKAACISAAAVGVGMQTRFVKPASGQSDLTTLCKTTPAHQDPITDLRLSADGKYLLSLDEKKKVKCWDFGSHELLGNAAMGVTEFFCTAFLSGKSTAVTCENDSVKTIEVPGLKAGPVLAKISIEGGGVVTGLEADSSGDFYGVSSYTIFHLKNNSGKYNEPVILKDDKDRSRHYAGISILSEGRYLFVLLESGCGLFDILSGELTEIDSTTEYGAYAVMPGGAQALLCKKKDPSFRLVSLTDGSTIWEKTANETIVAAAVTPDGSYGVLAGAKNGLSLISMRDGSELHRLSAGITEDTKIAVSKDGTQAAVSAGQSILFISLPDFSIIGCPVDLSEMKDNTKGVEVQRTDAKTGKTVTFTLPCDAPIPEGAVCICNCVEGKVCSCDGHCTCDTVCSCVGYTYCSCDTVCSCVGYTYCSCDTVCTCDAESGHYWYPD